jgi:hypothetical protein
MLLSLGITLIWIRSPSFNRFFSGLDIDAEIGAGLQVIDLDLLVHPHDEVVGPGCHLLADGHLAQRHLAAVNQRRVALTETQTGQQLHQGAGVGGGVEHAVHQLAGDVAKGGHEQGVAGVEHDPRRVAGGLELAAPVVALRCGPADRAVVQPPDGASQVIQRLFPIALATLDVKAEDHGVGHGLQGGAELAAQG